MKNRLFPTNPLPLCKPLRFVQFGQESCPAGNNFVREAEGCRWELKARNSSVHLFSKLGSVSSCSKMSWHTCTRRSFCLSFSNLATIFAQIFLIPRSSVMVLHTLLLFIPSSSAIILTVRRRSLRTFCLMRSTFSSVLLVDGLPLLRSSSISSPLFEPPVPLKKTSSWHRVSTIDFVKEL